VTEASPGRGRTSKHLIVVGSGIAGLYSALLAAEAGAQVTLLTKGALADSNTYYAQGGISAVLDEPAPGDTVAAHIADTLNAGAGHCDEDAVRVLCTEARRDIAGLERFGVGFDLDDDGGPSLGLEAAHSAPRILHAGGDATGARIAAALIRSVLDAQAAGRIHVAGHALVTRLSKYQGRVTGVEYLRDGQLHELEGDAVLLATGGAGQIFAQTSNPSVATADGLALAWRAGAQVADLEFFQFHPTCLAGPALDSESNGNQGPLLISEAVRGEGAILVDEHGKRFMPGYHPDAELAPRDVVSRSIALHLAALGNRNGHVYLDARVIEAAKGPGYLEKRFPTISRRTRDAGINWTRELVPVAPAAHYWMGGISTDLHGRTSVPGLFAAGEVACTGVQGANRLASNSLLEGLVFGRRAVEAFLDGVPAGPAESGGADWPFAGQPGSWGTAGIGPGPIEVSFVEPGVFSRTALRQLMTAKAGVIRKGVQLREAAAALAGWAAVEPSGTRSDSLDPREHEDANLLLAAQLLVHAARERRTSLGAHHRVDSRPVAAEAYDDRYTMSRKASLVP
jgi:L-aspartate oxidase